MREKDEHSIIPPQETGKAIETEGAVRLNNVPEAKTFFNIVVERLRNVNQWNKLTGNLSARFQLMDGDGNNVNRNAEKGDYFKIDIPGPGSKTGGGYDWVQIEEIEIRSTEGTDTYAFRVRPTQNPLNKRKDIAHFYAEEATSTFLVARVKNIVWAAIYDRNTKPNKDADLPFDKIRDKLVGIAGILRFSKIQWKNLLKGLLNK